MIYGLIRIIICTILFVIVFFVLEKHHTFNKHGRIAILLVFFIIFQTLLAFIPFENAFLTFSSIESAYSYNNKGEAKFVVEGKETDFVIGGKENNYVISIIPKSNNGWKIGLGVYTKKLCHKVYNKTSVDLYQYKDSDEYYIVVTTSKNNAEIKDNRNTRFYYYSEEDDMFGRSYCAYINDFNNQYTLTINGEEFDFQDL